MAAVLAAAVVMAAAVPPPSANSGGDGRIGDNPGSGGGTKGIINGSSDGSSSDPPLQHSPAGSDSEGQGDDNGTPLQKKSQECQLSDPKASALSKLPPVDTDGGGFGGCSGDGSGSDPPSANSGGGRDSALGIGNDPGSGGTSGTSGSGVRNDGGCGTIGSDPGFSSGGDFVWFRRRGRLRVRPTTNSGSGGGAKGPICRFHSPRTA